MDRTEALQMLASLRDVEVDLEKVALATLQLVGVQNVRVVEGIRDALIRRHSRRAVVDQVDFKGMTNDANVVVAYELAADLSGADVLEQFQLAFLIQAQMAALITGKSIIELERLAADLVERTARGEFRDKAKSLLQTLLE